MHALHSAANQAAARRISLAAWFLAAVLAIASPIRVASEEAADPDKPVQKCTGIGIDLGTTFSAVAILQQDSMEVINNKHGNSITPSIVAFEEDGSVLVGEQADNLLSTLPERTIYAVKRIIGRPIDDPVVQKEMKSLPYKVVKDPNSQMAAVKIGDKIITIPYISSFVLKEMNKIGNNYLSTHSRGNMAKETKHAVITVPAYYNDNQRKETKLAASVAGIEVLQILSEPVAAAVASKQLNDAEGNLLVIDIGGGTSDISVLEIEQGVYSSKATTGDLNLGGLDFTQEIVNIIKKKPNCDTAAIDPAARFKQAEQIKIALSTQAVVDYEIDEKCSGTISQAEYHKTVKKYEKRILELAAKAVETANLKKSEITNVLVTGGSARSKFLYDALKLAYQMEPIVSDQPDTAIAEGAATVAALLCGHSDAEKVLISQSVFGYAVKSIQGTQEIAAYIIDANVPVPATYEKTFSTYSDHQPSVTVEILQGFSSNPKECTRIGTIQYEGLPLKRAGQAQVKIEFQITEDQVLTARVTGTHKDAHTMEHAITLHETKVDDEQIKKMQQEAEKNDARFNFIGEVEAKMSEAFYATTSSITASFIEESHKKFIEDWKKKWNQLKAQSELELDQLKSKAEEMLEEAMPIVAKVVEAKNKALQEFDSKQADSASEAASSSSGPGADL